MPHDTAGLAEYDFQVPQSLSRVEAPSRTDRAIDGRVIDDRATDDNVGPTTERLKFTLLALTLNEIDGVKAVLPKIDRSWFEQILIVDGGSTDGTVEWCRENGYEVHVQTRPGIRFAYFEVLPKIRGNAVVSFSPDGNCLAEAIPQLQQKLQDGNDLVIASRYLGSAHSDDDDIVTGFGNWLFTRTVNVLHGGRYTDVMGIFRAYRLDLIYNLGLHLDEAYETSEKLFGTTISWEPLMSVRAAKYGLRIAEIPADEPARLGGVRKLQILRWGAAYYFQFWAEKFSRKRIS